MAHRVEIRRVRTAGELLDAFAVRRNVFIIEQGVPESIERDDLDASAEHAVAYVDGVAAGAGRLVIGDTARIGRMAVRAAARGRGIGAGVLAALESIARDRGCASVELHAQLHAAGFYRHFGYEDQGPPFAEAGIAHIAMIKKLDA